MNSTSLVLCVDCKGVHSVDDWNEATAFDCGVTRKSIVPLQLTRRDGDYWYICPNCLKEVNDDFPKEMYEVVPTTNSEARHLLKGG